LYSLSITPRRRVSSWRSTERSATRRARIGLDSTELLAACVYDRCAFAASFGEHLFCLIKSLLSDPTHFEFRLSHGPGHRRIAFLRRLINHQMGGFSDGVMELLINGDSICPAQIELTRRIRLQLDGFRELLLQVDDVTLAIQHLLAQINDRLPRGLGRCRILPDHPQRRVLRACHHHTPYASHGPAPSRYQASTVPAMATALAQDE
jgi:hypothetical protein